MYVKQDWEDFRMNTPNMIGKAESSVVKEGRGAAANASAAITENHRLCAMCIAKHPTELEAYNKQVEQLRAIAANARNYEQYQLLGVLWESSLFTGEVVNQCNVLTMSKAMHAEKIEEEEGSENDDEK